MKIDLSIISQKLQPVKNKLKHPMIQCALISLGLNFFVEIMSRRSLWAAFGYLFTNPLVFLYNTLIIMSTLSLALFFKRRAFAYSIISFAWIVIGVTDFILLLFRTTPFTAVDIILIKSAIDIWQYYLKFYHLILIGAAIVLAVAGLVLIFRKSKKHERTIKLYKLILFSVITFASAFGFTQIGLKTNMLAANFGNLANAYHSYGLPYCFVNSVINTGIDKPDIYSSEVVNTIVDGVEQGKVITSDDISPTSTPEPVATSTPSPTATPTPIPEVEEPKVPTTVADDRTPNIIFIQLESFFDPTNLIGATFTNDPIPTFHKLMEEYSSGYLSVPSVGAGTANTEFEVITGMNLDFFGPGEYPYKTILQKTTCESIGFNLKPFGYTAHAIHNNTGTFYDRHLVFSQLGFNSFTSVEYMQNIERTPLNWAKDEVLVNEIKKSLDSTQNQDFIYTISVQGHGSYPDYALLEDPAVDVSLSEELPSGLYYPLLYYSNQIHEMDQFVSDLIDYLSSRDEKTVLVMYGDHLPGFQITESNLTNGDLYQTPYVIWNNFDLPKEDKNQESYQLAADVLNRLDIHNGLITKLHQTQKDSDIYLDELKVLEYDMLYGKLECFGGVNPYVATDLTMGTLPIKITHAEYIENTTNTDKGLMVVNGTNFTPYSKVYIDDKVYDTIFINDSMIVAVCTGIVSGDKINVIQSGTDMYELSRTSDYILK